MKITIEIEDNIYALAQRNTLDPKAHCVMIFNHWAELTRQNHPGKTDAELLAMPTMAEQAVEQERLAALAAQEREDRTAFVEGLMKDVPEDVRSQVSGALSKTLIDDTTITAEQCAAKIAACQAEETVKLEEAAKAEVLKAVHYIKTVPPEVLKELLKS